MEGSIEKYLPIGSVVLLKGGKVLVMVTGYLGMNPESGDEVFDYMGIIYPIGIISSNMTLMFNHEQIEKLEHKGFVNDECKEMLDKLKTLSKEEMLKEAKEAAASGNMPEVPTAPTEATGATNTVAPAPAAPANPTGAVPASDIFNNPVS